MQPDTSDPTNAHLPSLQELGDTLLSTLTDWLSQGVALLPNLVLAVLLLFVGSMAARVIASGVRRALNRVSHNAQVNNLLATLTRVGIIGLALFGALVVLRLDTMVTSMLAGVGVVGLALGFAFQDIAANLMSGVMLAVSRPFGVGDLIQTKDYFGTVEHVDLRVTHLRTLTGELVLIPNEDVYNEPLVNFTETSTRRVDVEVGVGYDDDLDLAIAVLTEAMESLDFRHPDRDVGVFFQGFGGSSIDMVCQVWLPMAGQTGYLEARSKMVRAIKQAIDEAGLNIPFPIRTLDFGARPVGGQRLDDVLRPVFGDA